MAAQEAGQKGLGQLRILRGQGGICLFIRGIGTDPRLDRNPEWLEPDAGPLLIE